jgi:DNA mismatch repair ATPase MutS
MQVDRQTLADLEIVMPEWRGRDLFAFLDHTQSAGGRARLRSLLVAPLAEAAQILERQNVLRELSSRLPQFELRDLGQLVEWVERYLTSTYIELPRSGVASIYVGFRYPEMVTRLIEGLEATAQLLFLSQQIVASLETLPSKRPELLSISRRLRGCFEKPAFATLMRVRKNRMRRFNLARLDELIRRNNRDALIDLVDALHQLDALQSLARVSSLNGFVYPSIVDDREPFLSVEGAFHPLLANPIRTDVRLARDVRLIFLTGPNMAGKTTYLKTCGVIALLAHIGMAVPARSARLSTFDILFSVMTTHDSVARGESFFLAEVRRVGELAQHLAAGRRVLGLADEMFKGTNVMDALDATSLVVMSIARCHQGVFIVSSHLIELAERLRANSSIALMQFDVDMMDGTPSFTYELKPGVSDKRLGMFLLRREGVAQTLAAISDGRAASRSDTDSARSPLS